MLFVLVRLLRLFNAYLFHGLTNSAQVKLVLGNLPS